MRRWTAGDLPVHGGHPAAKPRPPSSTTRAYRRGSGPTSSATPGSSWPKIAIWAEAACTRRPPRSPSYEPRTYRLAHSSAIEIDDILKVFSPHRAVRAHASNS